MQRSVAILPSIVGLLCSPALAGGEIVNFDLGGGYYELDMPLRANTVTSPPPGTKIVTLPAKEVRLKCSDLAGEDVWLGCADVISETECVVYLTTDLPHDVYTLVRWHEFSHCAGWDHGQD